MHRYPGSICPPHTSTSSVPSLACFKLLTGSNCRTDPVNNYTRTRITQAVVGLRAGHHIVDFGPSSLPSSNAVHTTQPKCQSVQNPCLLAVPGKNRLNRGGLWIQIQKKTRNQFSSAFKFFDLFTFSNSNKTVSRRQDTTTIFYLLL